MEASGFKMRLEEAKNNSEYLKILFQYPGSNRVIVKRGYVLECYSDSFSFEEIIDGVVVYAYGFISEIIIGEKKE
jgi:hypothetical protein